MGVEILLLGTEILGKLRLQGLLFSLNIILRFLGSICRVFRSTIFNFYDFFFTFRTFKNGSRQDRIKTKILTLLCLSLVKLAANTHQWC